MKDTHKILLRYSVTTLIAGLMTLFVMYLRNFWSAVTLVEKYRTLADALTIPGVFLIMITALVWVSSEGFFDGLGYAFSRVGGMLIPFYKKGLKHETYYEYKQRQADKKAHGYSFLLVVGLAFTAVAIVFIMLHESVYVPMV